MSEIFVIFGIIIAICQEIFLFLLEYSNFSFEQTDGVYILFFFFLESSNYFF